MNQLGSWQYDVKVLQSQFQKAEPYSHIILDNFFSHEYAESMFLTFPPLDDKWISYWNPIEKKYALNKFDKSPVYTELFEFLQSVEFVNLMQKITGITNLENDPHLHGAGVHFHPKGGKLDMHLDYSVHPITKKERRVNLIIYMNKDWDTSYGGDLQLWDKDFTGPKQRIYPVFNRAVLFQTNDISYHGMPQMINCELGNGRKSIAIYYVSDRQTVGDERWKAHFRPLPTQPVNDKLKTLYSIRNTKTITNEILKDVYPDWENDGGGYW